MGRAYYNEFDPFAAQWLRNLIDEGHIAPGDVDERSIVEVQASDLEGYTQVHFFAGIGGWSCALRLAGWPDDRPVWTGSCPCQPFSAAGKRKGEADERHLWPEMARLVGLGRPPAIFGEQVASDDGCRWLAGVFADLEALGYRVAGADLCAAGVGSPNIRQRLWWVADSDKGRLRIRTDEAQQKPRGRGLTASRHGPVGRVEHAAGNGREQRGAEPDWGRVASRCRPGGLPDVLREGLSTVGTEQAGARAARADAWSNYDTIPCADGAQRRIEPGLSALAHGIPGRVGRLRGYGNAIVPQLAAEFIKAACG